jgi:hypothetical protein
MTEPSSLIEKETTEKILVSIQTNSNLLHFFKYSSLHKSFLSFDFDIDNYSQDTFIGFGMLISESTLYFVTNTLENKIYIFDEDWQYLDYKTFFMPKYIITVGRNMFITGEDNIWKTDKSINILVQTNPDGRQVEDGYYCESCDGYGYKGLYSIDNFLYVAHFKLDLIEIYNLNLVFDSTIQIMMPWSISGFNNQIFVGNANGDIFLIMDKTIVKQFDGCINHYSAITSIVFDSYGYMATSCADKLYLFYSNGTYSHKRFTSGPRYYLNYLAYDSKGRFVILSYSEICM